MKRQVCLVLHANRDDILPLASEIATRLRSAGIDVAAAGEAVEPGEYAEVDPERNELAIVLGGDGTILRAAELMRDARVPILGINLGKVGFLAELEPGDVDQLFDVILHRSWVVEERRALNVRVTAPDGTVW